MAAARTVWEYSGLLAAAYDRYFGAEPFWDQGFFEGRLRASGGRALELACGTGRLLVPLLRDGLDVEGLDTSADMLAILEHKARALGLSPVLHRSPMQDFDLPSRYRTVFVPAGTFMILIGDEEIDATLACCLRALAPGGELLIPLDGDEPPPGGEDEWRERRNVEVPEYGARLRCLERSHYDPATRLTRWQLRYEVDRPGEPRQTFDREHLLRHHPTEAFCDRLARCGFAEVAVQRGYTGPQPADPDSDRIFSARCPSH